MSEQNPFTDPTEQPIVRRAESGMDSTTRAELDVQISTAKAYPRSLHRARANAEAMATMDIDTAASCFYKIPRKDKGGQRIWIEGPSVRLAEIFATSWGNMRYGAQPVSEDGRFVTVQGAAHDLEANVSYTVYTKVGCTYKDGKTFNDDMIGVTTARALAIAGRNAILKVIPRTFINQLFQKCKIVAVGDAKGFSQRRTEAVAYFTGKVGVTLERLLATFGRTSVDDLDAGDLENLRGLATAIRDGETTLDDAFPVETVNGAPVAAAATEKIAKAAKRKAAPTPEPAPAAQEAPEEAPPEPDAPEASEPPQVDPEPAAAAPPKTWAEFYPIACEAGEKAGLQPGAIDISLDRKLMAKGCKGKPQNVNAATLARWAAEVLDPRYDWAEAKLPATVPGEQ